MKDAIGITILLIIFTWITLFTQFSLDYNTRQQAIENIVYRYTQVAAKKGEMSSLVYEEMEKKLNLYGEFDIILSAEKFSENDVAEYTNDILDTNLREEGFDIINVYAQSRKPHLIKIVMHNTPFGDLNKSNTNYYLIAKSSSYVK